MPLAQCRPDRRPLPSDFDIARPCSSSVQPQSPPCDRARHLSAPTEHSRDDMEPAAILVAALEIEIGRPAEDPVARPAPPAADPDSNHTSTMSISLRNSARRRTARRPCLPRASVSAGIVRIPGVRAFALKERHDALVQRRIFDRLAALGAEKHRNRHAPDPLPRDAPVGPRRTIFEMRSLPHAGSHFTCSISSSAYCRKVRRRAIVAASSAYPC